MIKTKQVLLSDEKIALLFETQGHSGLLAQSVAKEQLKQVAEWGNEPCPHSQLPSDTSNCYQPLNLTPLKKRECPECWQSLLKELEGKP